VLDPSYTIGAGDKAKPPLQLDLHDRKIATVHAHPSDVNIFVSIFDVEKGIGRVKVFACTWGKQNFENSIQNRCLKSTQIVMFVQHDYTKKV